MNRKQDGREAGLHAFIVASIIATLVADYLTPTGIALWVFYLVPLSTALFTRSARTPLLVAAACSILLVIGLFVSPQGISTLGGILNRVAGILTVWVVGAVGYRFVTARNLLQDRDWLKAGQAGIAPVVQGEQRLAQLGDKALRYVADYLGAQVGALYVDEGSGEYRRVASYALDSDAPREYLRPGDGLAGQAVAESRTVHLQGLPARYLKVGSALGETATAEVVIAPAVIDGVVVGVLELGFLRPVRPIALELVELFTEPIAVACRSSLYRLRLEQLLEETQRQAEELQAQQEELRAANHELEEQSNALRASQERLEAQQTELEQTNAQLEEQTTQLEEQRRELIEAHAALTEKAAELQRTSTYKSEFLANMSHELRTPLNSLLILARLLSENREGNLGEEQVKFASTIYSAGNDLLALINDILDLAKIESGKLELRPERVGVVRLVEETARSFEALARQKGLRFEALVDPGTPEELETDPQRLQQILRNLLSNAFKFTDAGEVSFRVSSRAGDLLAFSVRDTGIGIAPAQHELIFEAFRQADGTTNRKYGGTGLGLSICRDLARRFGGTISVESEPGRGSTFTLLIPRAAGRAAESVPASQLRQASPRTPPAPAPLIAVPAAPAPRAPAFPDDREELGTSKRVLLVVEDDPPFARILYDLAREQGFRCLVAETAEEGVALARQHAPAAIVLDVRLPDHSGLSVLDRLKRDPSTRHIPVHVVSALDEARSALSMGAVGYLRKPVEREQLVRAMQLLEKKLTNAVRRVLVVEDDAIQREAIGRLLSVEGVETVSVGTAAGAIEQLSASVFDCMVMDLVLPDATGFDLLERMANGNGISFPPVIVYTARQLDASEEQRLRRYSSSIIIKSARSPERLLDEVTLFLHQVESTLPQDRQQMLRAVRARDSVLEGRRVLVVEDDVRNVFALSSVLEPKGAKVEIARNGRQALEALQRGPVDLVLMDVMMPEMDGLEATRIIRSREEWSKLPIIAITAKAMPDDQARCLEAGANDYIPKPIDVEKLLSLVRVWMPK